MKDWVHAQRVFWDLVAGGYDDLYAGAWSSRENQQVAERLRRLLPQDCSILDLACGTGLGYRLATGVTTVRSYTGVDLSSGMLKVARSRVPCGRFLEQDMSDLDVPEGEFDAILALFSSLSYSADPAVTLELAFKALKPGGVLLISGLSRFSLRRLCRLRLGVIEYYGTRGVVGMEAPLVHTFTPRELRSLGRRVGFVEGKVWGQSVLAGIWEQPRLWRLNCVLSSIAPSLAHSLYFEARRSD